MKPRHKIKSTIPGTALKSIETDFLKAGLILKTYKEKGNQATILISLRCIQENFECFSDWSKRDMKIFWEFNRSIHTYLWQQIIQQGGKRKKKVGFGYTKIPKYLYPANKFLSSLSSDIDIFELRLNERMRVHGFRDDSIFYICWLDKDHRTVN